MKKLKEFPLNTDMNNIVKTVNILIDTVSALQEQVSTLESEKANRDKMAKARAARKK